MILLRAKHGQRGVSITLKGVNETGTREFEDTVELTYEEWCLVLECLEAPVQDDRLVALLCKVDL